MEKQNFENVQVCKYEKTVMSRLARIAKSLVHSNEKIDQQFSLRYLLSEGFNDYKKVKVSTRIGYQTFSKLRVVPIGVVTGWGEVVNKPNSFVKMNMDCPTISGIQNIRRMLPEESRHLIIGDEVLVDCSEEPIITSLIALGLFLIHIGSIKVLDNENFQIISSKCHKFIEPGESIEVRLYLFTVNSYHNHPHEFMDDRFVINACEYVDFTFTNGGITISGSGIGKTRSREYDICEEINPYSDDSIDEDWDR